MTPSRSAAGLLSALALVLAGCGPREKTEDAARDTLPQAGREDAAEASGFPDSAAAAMPGVRSPQSEIGRRFALELIGPGDVDSLVPYLEERARPYVTPEAVKNIVAPIKWFYDIIGGDLEELLSGGDDSSFFREYRLVNETSKRAPLFLVQVVFADSTTPFVAGVQVKPFLNANETPIAGERTWELEGREYDLHSIAVMETGQGNILAVQFYDEDTGTVNQEYVAERAIPLIREAMARGYADSARAVLKGKPLMDDVGVVFIRQDRREGLVHIKVSFRPEDYSADAAPPADKPEE